MGMCMRNVIMGVGMNMFYFEDRDGEIKEVPVADISSIEKKEVEIKVSGELVKVYYIELALTTGTKANADFFLKYERDDVFSELLKLLPGN